MNFKIRIVAFFRTAIYSVHALESNQDVEFMENLWQVRGQDDMLLTERAYCSVVLILDVLGCIEDNLRSNWILKGLRQVVPGFGVVQLLDTLEAKVLMALQAIDLTEA